MTAVHRIRLQAAWETSAAGGPWTRSFGRPTGLGAADRVWLVVERPDPGARDVAVALNGRELPAIAAGTARWRHDVTGEVRDRNELRLDFGAAGEPGAPVRRGTLPESLGAVALEIESAG